MATKHAVQRPKTAHQKEMSTNNFIALVAVGSVLIVLVAGYFSYQLIKANIRNAQVIRGKLVAQADLKAKLVDANTLVGNYNSLTPQQKQLIASALPITKDFPQIVSLIESAGTNAGLRIKSLAVSQAVDPTTGSTASQKPTSAGPAQPQPFTFVVSIDGSYQRVTQFFKNIELSARPMKVDSFELRGNTGSLNGNLTVQTYYQDKADISDKKEVVK